MQSNLTYFGKNFGKLKYIQELDERRKTWKYGWNALETFSLEEKQKRE